MENPRIEDYRFIISDLDGTLYFQPPLRMGMAIKMMRHCITKPLKISDIFIVYLYRKFLENEKFSDCEDSETQKINYLATKFHKDSEMIRQIIDFWMIESPLKLIKKHRDKKLIDILKASKKNGSTIVVYSDYPTEKKLGALGLEPDYAFYSGDEIINCFKPKSDGLKNIITMLGCKASEVLFIGDRDSKDGECARACSIDYMILDRSERGRQYE